MSGVVAYNMLLETVNSTPVHRASVGWGWKQRRAGTKSVSLVLLMGDVAPAMSVVCFVS
jgi:hypothetical protein